MNVYFGLTLMRFEQAVLCLCKSGTTSLEVVSIQCVSISLELYTTIYNYVQLYTAPFLLQVGVCNLIIYISTLFFALEQQQP